MKGRSLFALAVLSLALACEGNQQPTGPSPAAPLDAGKIIQDGAHGGNKDFWWLPPMVPLPSHHPDFVLGTFNNALRPSLRIEICQLDGLYLNSQGVPTSQTACASGIPLKKTYPAGTVNLVNLPLRQNGWWNLFNLPPDGFYYVLWDTRQSNLDVSKFYRISVFVQGKPDALGVADVDPMSSLRQWKYSLTGEVIQLVDDVMLPITFRVERGALCESGQCNSATITNSSPSGSQSITVDAGGGSITGATFPNGWLPSGTQCAPANPCPQSVVVTINEVNTPGSGLPGESTVCHPGLNPKLQQFRGCFHFSTTPALQSINEAGDQFAQPVTVGVCYELELNTNDPRRAFVELYASGPNEPPHRLEDVAEGVLVASKDCSRPPVIGYRGANPLIQLASAGWLKVKGGLDQAFGIKTAHAIDLGLGGIVKGFSNISPVMTANIVTYTNTELSLPAGATTTSTARIVGNSHHATNILATGIGGVSVTYTPSGGSKLQALGSAVAPTTSPVTVITNLNPVVDGSPTSGGGFAPVNWTMPTPTAPGTYTYTLTADGPALGGPVTFTSTVIVAAAPDFVISTGAPTVTPSTVNSGGSVTLSAWTVRNDGGPWAGSISNGFYLSTDPTITSSDTFLDENTNTSSVLPPGGSFNWGGPTLTIPASTAPGVYYIGILVDRNGAVTESNESNNFVSVPVIVARPDEGGNPWAPQERRMLSMQTGAAYHLAVAPSFSGLLTWVSSDNAKVSVTHDDGFDVVYAIVGGENISGGDAVSITSTYAAGNPFVDGPSMLVDSFNFILFPRVTTLAWPSVVGAVAYHAVTEYGNGSDPSPPFCRVPSTCTTWTQLESTYTVGRTHTLNFVGGQPGRWRVFALDATGTVINTSPYIYFAYDPSS